MYDKIIITFNKRTLARVDVFKNLGISDIGRDTIKIDEKSQIRKSEYGLKGAHGQEKEGKIKRRRSWWF